MSRYKMEAEAFDTVFQIYVTICEGFFLKKKKQEAEHMQLLKREEQLLLSAIYW